MKYADAAIFNKTTMLEFDSQQRALLADELADVANVAAGAWLFGQLLGGGAFSARLALGGLALWGATDGLRSGPRKKEQGMTGFFVFVGGLVLMAGIVTLLDGIAYRRRHKAQKHP